MFDIGFSELLVIGVVALVVIGPERLPKVARTAGLLLGRMQRYAAQVKAEVDREMKLEELHKLQDQFRQADATARHVILEEKQGIEQQVQALGESVHAEPGHVPPAPDKSPSLTETPAAPGEKQV
ncbi:MAG: Sec-independent protein translocase protein TatB [Sulfuricellaceae bacterium]|nr:Sec-independent protein translocase protein TatB [Sulfuricellaceae bacterium]